MPISVPRWTKLQIPNLNAKIITTGPQNKDSHEWPVYREIDLVFFGVSVSGKSICVFDDMSLKSNISGNTGCILIK